MKKTLLSLVLLGGAVALTGCQTVSSSERADKVGRADYVKDARVISDGDTDKIARILSVSQDTKGDLLRVQYIVQNTRPITQSFNYRWQWYDQNLMEVKVEPWQTMTLEGKDQRAIIGVAPTGLCKDWRFAIKEITQR